MKKPSNILLILIILLLSFEINAQDKASNKLVKEEGWNLPSISEAVEVEKGKVTFNNKQDKDAQEEKLLIDAQAFDLKKPIRDKVDAESSDSETVYRVTRSFIIYSLNGKVFAYSLPYVGAYTSNDKVINGVTYKGVSGYLGCAGEFYYLDEDGDGKFEARYYTYHFR
jgi:hypothetical protein